MLDTIKVSNSDIQRIVDNIVTYLNSNLPNGNFSEGTTLHDLVVLPIATVISAIESDVSQLENRLSVDFLQQEETESASALMDQLASNFFISRNVGERSSGVVTLVLNSKTDVVIPIGTIFERSTGIEFAYDQDQPLVIPSSDLEEEKTNQGALTGNYLAQVYVTGARESVGSGMPPGEFSSMTNPPKGLLRIYNSEPFTIAQGQESNYEFADRIKDSLTIRGFNTDLSISTVLRDSLEYVRSAYSVGTGHPAMQRDILQIGTEYAIHTGGKINIVVDTGFSPIYSNTSDAQSYSFSAAVFYNQNGEEVPIKSVINGLEYYGDKYVGNLVASNETRVAIESEYVELTYEDYFYSRSLKQDVSIASNLQLPLQCKLYSPRNALAVDTYISSSGVKPLGIDAEVYYPVIKRLEITLSYKINKNVEGEEFPVTFIQSSVSKYVSDLQKEGLNLSVADLYGYVSNTFSTFISALNHGTSAVKYSILLPDGSLVYYETDYDTSLSSSRSYYKKYRVVNGVTEWVTEYDHVTIEYLNSMQVSDEYCVLYCDPSDVILVEE